MKFRHDNVDYHFTFRPKRRQIGVFIKVRDSETGKVVLLQHLYILYLEKEVLIVHDGIRGLRGYVNDKVSFENEKYVYEYDRVRDKTLKKQKR